ncbi:2Fe-2S iron-sulfur cluster binding domain-containing protein [Ramlibacter ginsenosidimutans]|uniref:2Fe-2S iron-sulfur cluster binding domain-containing protein n=1 Tax=Ramlibacter ginsenosidimutans TaxID=502333 RepID=A0A934WM33_9BURK|nr:2Fe-2S iron-sulfur cluster-binding protein [Ramlibacter ginsenosidimutans]MBK6006063.1 2Fe-2S iron-sulfur cluster binding domain-containing protein [Ramlibacter ginsenosidimutans]
MSYRVCVQDSGASFVVAAGEPLLEAALRQGVRLPHECTFGGCGTCRIKLVEGQVRYEEMPLALSPQEAQAGHALACQARACSDLVISLQRADDAPAAERRRAVVRAVRRWTPDVVNLQLEVEADRLDYRPGQYMNVLLDDGTHRSFSMASAPAGNRVDFHVRRIAGGRFTDEGLRRLAQGDRLDVEIPLGNFRLHAEDYRPIVMAATGTGLAPIKSMLETLMDDDDCPPVSLYWGVRTEADLYLADEIRTWGERLYEFDFVPVLSRAGADWRGRRGHVQDAVAQDFGDLSEHALYLCGSPAMIADAKQRFLALGADLDHLYVDGFTFQHEAAT